MCVVKSTSGLLSDYKIISFQVLRTDNYTDIPQTGDGDIPQTGDGDIPQIGDGNIPQTGDGDIPKTGDDDDTTDAINAGYLFSKPRDSCQVSIFNIDGQLLDTFYLKVSKYGDSFHVDQIGNVIVVHNFNNVYYFRVFSQRGEFQRSFVIHTSNRIGVLSGDVIDYFFLSSHTICFDKSNHIVLTMKGKYNSGINKFDQHGNTISHIEPNYYHHFCTLPMKSNQILTIEGPHRCVF